LAGRRGSRAVSARPARWDRLPGGARDTRRRNRAGSP
jgi:hypothetical protein